MNPGGIARRLIADPEKIILEKSLINNVLLVQKFNSEKLNQNNLNKMDRILYFLNNNDVVLLRIDGATITATLQSIIWGFGPNPTVITLIRNDIGEPVS